MGASYSNSSPKEIIELIEFVNDKMTKERNRLIKKIKPAKYVKRFLIKEIDY